MARLLTIEAVEEKAIRPRNSAHLRHQSRSVVTKRARDELATRRAIPNWPITPPFLPPRATRLAGGRALFHREEHRPGLRYRRACLAAAPRPGRKARAAAWRARSH